MGILTFNRRNQVRVLSPTTSKAHILNGFSGHFYSKTLKNHGWKHPICKIGKNTFQPFQLFISKQITLSALMSFLERFFYSHKANFLINYVALLRTNSYLCKSKEESNFLRPQRVLRAKLLFLKKCKKAFATENLMI